MNLLYRETDSWAAYIEGLIEREFRSSWELMKPQFPKRQKSNTEVDPVTGEGKITIKYKPIKVMKKIPLRKMPSGLSRTFHCWYYDGLTGEAVIVLNDNGKLDSIRVFDPMWITNLDKEDIQTLHLNRMIFNIEHTTQAMQFVKVVRICFGWDIYRGVDWKKKSQEMQL